MVGFIISTLVFTNIDLYYSYDSFSLPCMIVWWRYWLKRFERTEI